MLEIMEQENWKLAALYLALGLSLALSSFREASDGDDGRTG